MKPNRDAIAGAVSALAAVGLVAWAAWFWLGAKPGTEAIVLPGPDSVKVVTGSPPQVEINIIKPVDEWGSQWAATGLPRATGHMGGPSRTVPEQPEPPLAVDQVICPSFQCVSISRGQPDVGSKEDLVGRSTEIYGLLKFDVSRLLETPKKAMLRAHVSYIENTCGYQTPLRLVFYRVKADWDDSATFRYASSRDQVEWKNGASFNASSQADVDPDPVAIVEIPNPCRPGFNLEADITPVVAAWQAGDYPNQGLLMHCDFGVGRSVQGNLATRKYTAKYAPQILCTVATPRKATTQPSPQAEQSPATGTVLDHLRNILTSK